MLTPLGGDQGGHRYRPIASLTHYAEGRIMPAWRMLPGVQGVPRRADRHNQSASRKAIRSSGGR